MTFPNGTKTQQTDLSLVNLNERIGIDIGAGYKIALSRRVFLVPQIRFLFNLSDISATSTGQDKSHQGSKGLVDLNESRTRLHSLKLLLDIWFDI
jgi:hypothetical protein